MPSTAQNVAAVQANVRANAQDMASYLQDLAQWTQHMSQTTTGSAAPSSTSSATAASGGTAADHTYDRGYAKWDTWVAVCAGYSSYQLTLARSIARVYALLCLAPRCQDQGDDEDTARTGPAAAPTASTVTSSQPPVPAPRAATAVEVAIGTTADRTCCRLESRLLLFHTHSCRCLHPHTNSAAHARARAYTHPSPLAFPQVVLLKTLSSSEAMSTSRLASTLGPCKRTAGA